MNHNRAPAGGGDRSSVSTLPKSSLEAGDHSHAHQKSGHKNKKRTWLILGALLAVLIIIGAVLGGVLGSRTAKKKVKLPTRQAILVSNAGSWGNGTKKNGWYIYRSDVGSIWRTFVDSNHPEMEGESKGENVLGGHKDRMPRWKASPLAECEISGKGIAMFYITEDNGLDGLWLPTLPGVASYNYTPSDLIWRTTTRHGSVTGQTPISENSDLAAFPVQLSQGKDETSCVVVYQNADSPSLYYKTVAVDSSPSNDTRFTYSESGSVISNPGTLKVLDGSALYTPPTWWDDGAEGWNGLYANDTDVMSLRRLYFQEKNGTVMELVWDLNRSYETRVVGDAIEKTPISMTITGGTNATLYALSAPNKVKYFWANDVTKNLRTVDRVEWKDGGEPKQLKTKKGIAALVNQWLTDSTVWIFEKDGHELIPNRNEAKGSKASEWKGHSGEQRVFYEDMGKFFKSRRLQMLE